MNELPLFNLPAVPERPRFDGADYRPDRDDARLTGQLQDIFAIMQDGSWRTLGEIELLTGHRTASVSAQLRNLRKKKMGGHVVNRRYECNGLYSYQLIAAKKD